jgi:excisionase family DNA binding protein
VLKRTKVEGRNVPSKQSRKSASVVQPVSQSQTQTPAGVVPRLLTPEEVAALLGTNRLFIIRQSRAGKIPAIKLGKAYRYRASSIASWLGEQERA